MDIEHTTEPIEPDDDLMTLEEFREAVEIGFLIDYDGYGVYATDKRKSCLVVSPSTAYDPLPEGPWTHVVWYNR